MIRWDWVAGNLDEIAAATLEHLQLTVIAVGVGFVLSLLLALLVHRWRRLYGPVAGIAGLLYTIPSLALFAVLVPFTGLTLLTAEIGLVGYTRGQRLARVELPLAVPVIVTAVRLATVTTVGLVMVTALIGEGGLGQLMLRGFNRSFPTMIYVGVIMSVVLAVALDLILVGLQRILTPWARARTG